MSQSKIEKIKPPRLITIEGLIHPKNDTYETFHNKVSRFGTPYELEINSVGGDNRETSKMIIYMVDPDSPLCTKTIGLNFVGSCAVYIFVNAEKRICKKDTLFHIHRSRDELTGEISLKPAKHELMFWKIVSIQTGTKIKTIEEIANANSGEGEVFGAKEARRLNLVTEIWY